MKCCIIERMDSTTQYVYHKYRLQHIQNEKEKQRQLKFADGTLQTYLACCWFDENDEVKGIVFATANTLP